jgi:hypothetical protein
MREIPARDALNAEIAKWKSDAIALVNRGEGIDEKDRRDILFAVVDSTLLAEHSYLRAAGADALTALSDRIRRQRLPSDNAYLPLFERIIEQDFDANDLAAANRHYAAIQAYRNLAGDAAARAFLAERLGRARQANNNDARLINIYAGLRAISSPTAAESQALTEAREPVRTRLNSINRGQQRARSLSFALRLFDAGATEFNAEVGKSFNDMLRFDMGANQPKERLEQNMEVISQICLRPNVVQDFSHIRQACGFPGGPEIRQVVMGQAIQSLQPIVASGRDESLARRAENLIQELENRAESLESSLAQQQTNPVARALANLPFLICLKPDRTTAQIQRQDLALLDDAARSRLCREQNLGEYLDPARGVIRENRDGEQAPAPAPSQLPAPAPARPVQEAT